MFYTESNYENAVISIFRDELGYRHVYAPSLDRDYYDPLYSDEFLVAIRRINPKMTKVALSEAVYKLRNIEGGTVLQNNMQFMNYLQNGISVSYFDKGEQRSGLVKLVDYENVDLNSFTIVNC